MNRLDGVLHRPVELAALIGHFAPLNKSCYATRLQLIAALASTRAKCAQCQSTSTTGSVNSFVEIRVLGRKKGRTFLWSANSQRRYTLMRELQVLGDGHLRLDFADWKEFFETEMAEQLRSQLKSMIEQALEAERDYYLQLNYYEHAPKCRLDYRNGYYFRDFLTQLARLAGVRIPRTRKGFRSQVLPRYQRRQAPVNQLIREPFLRGISTRQVSDVLQPVLGET